MFYHDINTKYDRRPMIIVYSDIIQLDMGDVSAQRNSKHTRLCLEKQPETPTNRETYCDNSRLDTSTTNNVQVKSYPGTKLCHADRIVSSYLHPQHPEKIILSFGLNNRSTEPRSTSFHNLRKLIGTTKKRTFPKSEIYFPLVNFATNLPQSK